MGARGVFGFAPLALILAVAATLPAASAARAQDAREWVLPGCGICYPGGYDANTVGEVQGRIADIETPTEGPVRIGVMAERERWVVLASPAGFWRGVGQRFVPGCTVIARGSKTLGADGTLYLIAQELRQPGEAAILLREQRGKPLWSGQHRASRRVSGEDGRCRSPR